MARIVSIFLILCCSSITIADATTEYKSLLKQYSIDSGKFRLAKSDGERKATVDQLGHYSKKFLALAEKNPNTPLAFQSLRQAVQAIGTSDSLAQVAWEMNHSAFPDRSENDSANQLVMHLLKDYVRSSKIVPVCERMGWGYRMEFEQFLSKVLEVNPHRKVQAQACISLAQFLNERLRVLQLVEDRPSLTQRYQKLFGKDYLKKLKQATSAKRVEALFERATTFGGAIGTRAKSALYEIRHLSIGKVAPEIAGKDQDGKSFKLSDYRGKVVLVYFWLEF